MKDVDYCYLRCLNGMTNGVRQDEYGCIKKNRPNSGYDALRHDPTRIRRQEGYMEKRRAFTALAASNNTEIPMPFFRGVPSERTGFVVPALRNRLKVARVSPLSDSES